MLHLPTHYIYSLAYFFEPFPKNFCHLFRRTRITIFESCPPTEVQDMFSPHLLGQSFQCCPDLIAYMLCVNTRICSSNVAVL